MDYLPHTQDEFQEMLRTIGVGSFEELLDAVPPELRHPVLALPPGRSEPEVLRRCGALAERNRSLEDIASFLGAGAYDHVVPTAVDAIASRGEWLTPYTPYQAEASQGLLQATYEFQTMVCELLQMDVANASMYDGASAAAEAVLLALRSSGRPRVLVSEAVHPHIRQVAATYLHGTPSVIQLIPTVNGVTDLETLGRMMGEDVAGVLLAHPNVFGCLEPMATAAELAHRAGSLFIASVYPVSLGLLAPPGAYGADLAVAEGRCLGNPLSYGGPGLGLLAASNALVRRLPGRLAGCTADRRGRRGFTLTLQTREQHIRRERATSNICTNQGWLALRATLYLSLVGPGGLRDVAQRNLERGHEMARRMTALGWIRPAFDQPFFNECALTCEPPRSWPVLARRLERAGIVGGAPLAGWFPELERSALWCMTEAVPREALDRLIETLEAC
ncbi:MAG TPA: aminomethyl-transferring glycine dehydrogenase subunit GcvPA [bacterium]